MDVGSGESGLGQGDTTFVLPFGVRNTKGLCT